MRGRLLTGLVVSLAVVGVPPRLAAAPLVTVAQAALTAADAAENDNFGFSVSLGGDTALIGAPGDDTPAGINAGSARVFMRSPQGWAEHATLTAPDAVADDRLGWSVAMDGDTAAVGVPFDDLDGAVNGGSVRVFARHGEVWTEQAVLTAPDPAEGDVFGFSVAVSGDTVLVGAVGDDTDDERGVGVAYAYVRSGETWPLQAELRPTDARASDNFGFSVGLDGDTAVVGMVGDDTPDVSEGGSARVFTRSGTQWTEQATLAASDAAPDDLFGYSVAVHRDTAVVGAVGDDTAAGVNAGSARVFARSGTAWQEVATLASGRAAPGTTSAPRWRWIATRPSSGRSATTRPGPTPERPGSSCGSTAPGRNSRRSPPAMPSSATIWASRWTSTGTAPWSAPPGTTPRPGAMPARPPSPCSTRLPPLRPTPTWSKTATR